MKILEKIEKSLDFWILLIISLFFFFLRLPSLFEPDWYGDEGIYQVLGLGINSGRLLYRDIFDNKPPLLYMLYSFVSSDLFLIRLLSLIFGILSVILFFFLAKKLLQNSNVIYISTGIFAVLFGLPLIEGNIANAENFMLSLNILTALLIFKSIEIKKLKTKYITLVSAGVIVGLSFLIKIVALFDFSAICIFLFFINYQDKLSGLLNPKIIFTEFKRLLPLILGFLIPIAVTVLYFILNNAFPDFITATFFSNIGYVGYGNKLIIPQGFLILKVILLFLLCCFVFYKRKSFGNSFSFILIWLGFSLFGAYFSQRPYTHYVLLVVPAFCLVMGVFLQRANLSKLAGLITLVTLAAVVLNFTFFTKTIFYYQNFISFISGQQSVASYQGFFDKNTPNDYEIASFLNYHLSPTDNIFIWGNNAQVYDLTDKLPPGKYTVAYHMTSYKDGFENTAKSLKEKKPKFIVIMPNVPIYPFSLLDYHEKVKINNTLIYEKLY